MGEKGGRMLDKKVFIVIMDVFFDIAGKELKPTTLDFYYDTLKQYDTETVKLAAQMILKTRSYKDIPTPAEFIKIIEGDNVNDANDAWETALKAIRSGKPCGIPLVDKLIASHNLMDLHTENIPYAKRDFMEAYKHMEGKEELHTQIGMSEELKKLTATIGGKDV
jgi:hypothetical protein